MWAALAVHTPLWWNTHHAWMVLHVALHALVSGALWFVARRLGRYYGTALVCSTLFAILPVAAPVLRVNSSTLGYLSYLVAPLATFAVGHVVGWIGAQVRGHRAAELLLVLSVTLALAAVGLFSWRSI